MWSVFLFLFLLHPCVSCPAGEYKTPSGCQTCPTGYTSLADDVSCFPSKRIAIAYTRSGVNTFIRLCTVENGIMTCNFQHNLLQTNVIDVQMQGYTMCVLYDSGILRCNRNIPDLPDVVNDVLSFDLYTGNDSKQHLDITFHSNNKKAFYKKYIVFEDNTNKYFQYDGDILHYKRSDTVVDSSVHAVVFRESIRLLENPRGVFLSREWKVEHMINDFSFIRCTKVNTTGQLSCSQLEGNTELGFEELMPPHDEVIDVSIAGKHICGIFRATSNIFTNCWRFHTAEDINEAFYVSDTVLYDTLSPVSQQSSTSMQLVTGLTWLAPTGEGCQNPIACNFDYLANETDLLNNPCATPFSQRYRCDSENSEKTRYVPDQGIYVHNPGVCIDAPDTNGNGWCDDEEVFGCVDTKACNSQSCSASSCGSPVGSYCETDDDCLSYTCIYEESSSRFKCAHPITEDVTFERRHANNVIMNWEYVTKPSNNFCRYPYNSNFRCKINDKRFPIISMKTDSLISTGYDDNNDVYVSTTFERSMSLRCIDIPAYESYCNLGCSDNIMYTNAFNQSFTTNDACCACGGGRIFDTSRGTPIMDFNQDGIPDPWSLIASNPLNCFFNPFNMTLLPNQTEYYYEQPYACISSKDRICDDPYASNYIFPNTSLAPAYRIDDRYCTYEFTVETTQSEIVTTSNRCALSGCTDPFACNFNVSVGIDDGSCEYADTCPTDIAIPLRDSETNIVKHCEVSNWSPWTPCTAYCGESTRTRTRTITQHPQTIFGAPCPDLQETESCNVPSCDTDFIVHIEHDTHVCKLYSENQLVPNVTVCPLHDYTYACANCLYTYQNISIRDTTFIGPNTGVFTFEYDNSISCAEQSLLIDVSFEGCSLEQLQTLYESYGCTSTCLSEQCTEIFNQITFKDNTHQQRCDVSTTLCTQENYDSFWLEETCSCNSPKQINTTINTCAYLEDSCGNIDGLNTCQDTCDDPTAKNYLEQNTACEYCPEGTSGENCQYCNTGYGHEYDRAYLLAPQNARPQKCYLCENDFYNNASNTIGPCATGSCPMGYGYYFARTQDSGPTGLTAAQFYIPRRDWSEWLEPTWPLNHDLKLNSITDMTLIHSGTVFRYGGQEYNHYREYNLTRGTYQYTYWVTKNGTWHTICDDNFNVTLAAEVCSDTCEKPILESEVSFSFEDNVGGYELRPFVFERYVGYRNGEDVYYNSTCTSSKRIAVTCPVHCYFDDNVITEDVLDIYDEQYSDGLSAQPVCLQCQPGSFSDSDTTGQCQACPTGFFTAQAGAEQCSPHSLCQPGTQRTNVVSTTVDTICESCPVGFYSTGNGACSACSCPSGKYSLGCGGGSAGECIDDTCITGEWSQWSDCVNCVETRTRDVLFKASGYVCPRTETQTCCTNECDQPGYDNYVSTASYGDASLCTCNEGRFYDGTSCKPFSTCEDGAQISVPGDATRDVECECIAGRFYNGTACQIHSTCNAGFEPVGGNATHDVECVACAAGTYSTDGSTCNLCADVSCPTGQDNRNCGGSSSGTCSKDCVVGPWSVYTDCSVVCGNGTKTRTRENQAPIGDGDACPTENSDTVACNTITCDQYCSDLGYDKADVNDVCTCNDGRFFDVDDDTCKPHSTCPLGTQRESDGTQTSDVTCATCEYIHCATATQIKNRYRTVVEQSCASMGNVTENIFARIADASRMQLYSAYMNRYNGTCTS